LASLSSLTPSTQSRAVGIAAKTMLFIGSLARRGYTTRGIVPKAAYGTSLGTALLSGPT